LKGDAIKTKILSIQVIPNANEELLKALKVPKDYYSLGIVTTDCDDVSYAALDEATKKADVRVVYARSMYAGSKNAGTALAGEFIGILAGREPTQVEVGMQSVREYTERAAFYSANADDSIVYFAHCISRSGSYLSRKARIGEGKALAYLIAPPNEAICGLDAALKAADVSMRVFYGPPTETNFAGGLLTGDQAACRAASEAFAKRIEEIADNPIKEIND
jgi:ethanolamine utilization protein EutL